LWGRLKTILRVEPNKDSPNNRLKYKLLAVTNTLAYNTAILITTIKTFRRSTSPSPLRRVKKSEQVRPSQSFGPECRIKKIELSGIVRNIGNTVKPKQKCRKVGMAVWRNRECQKKKWSMHCGLSSVCQKISGEKKIFFQFSNENIRYLQ